MSHHLVDFDGKMLRNTACYARLQTTVGMFSNNVRVALFSDTANALLMRLLISSLKSITNAFLNGQLVLTFRLSFLYFSRQTAENKFQLKSTILCDIALLFYVELCRNTFFFQEKRGNWLKFFG